MHNRPDIILKDKRQRKAYLIDTAVPGPSNMQNTVHEKVNKYKELSMELENQWKMKMKTLPIVITTTGMYQTTIQNLLELGCSKTEIRTIQKAAILCTTRMVRKVLGETH